MNNIIFHSLYNDNDFVTLKHTLLYFEDIVIPSNTYPASFGANQSHIQYLQLIPHEVRDQIDYLAKEKYLTIQKFSGENNGDISFYWKSISDGIENLGKNRTYDSTEILEICKYLNLDPKHPDVLPIANEASIFLAAVCLMEFNIKNQICCIDNQIIYDTLNLGVRGVIDSVKNTIPYREIKAKLLAQKIISLNLPSFELYSFDDVLEIKEKHKDNLLALHNYLFDISDKIEYLPFEPEFDNSVNNLINQRIQPEIEDFKKSISFSPSKLVKKSYDPLKNFGLSFGLSSAFPAYTTAIAATGIVYTVFETLIKYFKENKEKVKESPYNIFISINNND